MKNPALAGLTGLAAICAAVQAILALGWVSPLVLAAPTDIAVAIVDLFREESLAEAVIATFSVTLAAAGLAIGLGVPAGFLLYRFSDLGRAYEPWLGALFAAPMVLLYPLFLVIFGRSYLTVIVMGAITGVIPVILNTRVGLAEVPKHLVNVGISFNCSPSRQFWKILFPAAVPTIFTGVRLGLIYAMVNIIGIEFLVNFGGLGRVVSEMYDRFDVPGMYAAILFIVLVGAIVFVVLGKVQRKLRSG